MFDPVNEPLFRLDVAGLPEPLEVLAFTGREGFAEPYAFEVDVLIDDPHLDLAGLMFRAAFLQFGPAPEGVHGRLHSLVQHEHGPGARLCRVRLAPALSCLALRCSQRMFSGRSVPQILDQVLKEHGIVGVQRRFRLCGEYPARTFCTQYRESDLQFVQRLCAQAQIHYHFEHRRDGHCLVFGDDPAKLPQVRAGLLDGAGVHPWQARTDGRAQTVEGGTQLPLLRSGRRLSLNGPAAMDGGRDWLVARVEHQACTALDPPYRNRIACVAPGSPVPVPLPTAVPTLHSLQRAWVVGVDEPPPGPQRRVAVQFDWLYQGEGAAPSHCWLPLAPGLADVPPAALRDGVEVVVGFLEGDPDRPVISGILQAPADAGSDAGSEGEDDPPVEASHSEGLAQWLDSAQPLLLLCLIPGGGSLAHCPQPVCSCRLLGALGPGGAG
ncbi:type VI secretion protein [Pseudomonas sp. COR58]|uniref:Type VI secretion protein n=1 Tax=Pseudomonas ekonensis TaxID=2842353 RepID=A0ABS6PJ65_9PSED|nr:contractile injection system protein, VgrG/Pvc8 family [Pseudomonas ekonensis]MBV4460515.1 type VI secretion protein [Pseudomonas ekonensis]